MLLAVQASASCPLSPVASTTSCVFVLSDVVFLVSIIEPACFQGLFLVAKYYLSNSSPRASVKCRFGPSSAGFDLIDAFLSRCWFGCLSAGFALLSADFREKKRKRMKKQKTMKKNTKKANKIKIPSRAVPSIIQVHGFSISVFVIHHFPWFVPRCF